jgi:hypothetical protein
MNEPMTDENIVPLPKEEKDVLLVHALQEKIRMLEIKNQGLETENHVLKSKLQQYVHPTPPEQATSSSVTLSVSTASAECGTGGSTISPLPSPHHDRRKNRGDSDDDPFRDFVHAHETGQLSPIVVGHHENHETKDHTHLPVFKETTQSFLKRPRTWGMGKKRPIPKRLPLIPHPNEFALRTMDVISMQRSFLEQIRIRVKKLHESAFSRIRMEIDMIDTSIGQYLKKDKEDDPYYMSEDEEEIPHEDENEEGDEDDDEEETKQSFVL